MVVNLKSLSSENASKITSVHNCTAPGCCGVCCLHSLMHFNEWNNTQNCPFLRGIWPTPNTRLIEPTRVHKQNNISTWFICFCSAHGCDRQTDRQTHIYSTLQHYQVAASLRVVAKKVSHITLT